MIQAMTRIASVIVTCLIGNFKFQTIMIDYNKIKQDYPKAFELLVQTKKNRWSTNRDGKLFFGHSGKEAKFHDRDLFDFFDENRLYINISPSPNRNGCTLRCFVYDYDNVLMNPYILKLRKTRKESETDGFMKAFEILEEKLTA